MKNLSKKMIFCSGTGRSGTHLIGRSLASHIDIKGRIEDPYSFKIITKIATSQDYNPKIYNLFLKKILFYRLKRILSDQKKHILEKSHPSIWLFEDLIKKLDNLVFLGVYRDLEPTVNSMLNHNGVLSWYNKLPQNQNNRFLGITELNKDSFHKSSIEYKCACRWLSHIIRLEYLKDNYPEKILLIKYEDFVISQKLHLNVISDFLEIENKFNPEDLDTSKLYKWEINLNKDQKKKLYHFKINNEISDFKHLNLK